MLINTLYFINSLFFNFCIAFYLMSALQWYSYKFKRVFFHYHKPLWHLYFLFIPYFLFLAFPLYSLAYFALIHTPILYFWNKEVFMIRLLYLKTESIQTLNIKLNDLVSTKQ